MFNRKGNSYIEIMVVVAVLLIITLFAIPRYQDLRRDAFRAQVASDSRLVETYVMEEYFHNGDMPTGSTLLSDDELKDLIDNKKSYLKGEIISSADVDSIGGEKYKLDKDEVLKHVNTKLKGDFVYTDSGVIYINNVAASKGQEQNNQEQNNIDVEDLEKMIGPVKQVALGFFHSAAVTENGDLYTWGRNDEGQLGLGDTRDRSRPTKVDGLSNVKQVSLGNYHSAALTKDGSIYTWGSNWSGQLGLSDTSDKSRPTKVDSLSDVKQVVLGYSHSAALTEDGDLYTWGSGSNGKLGHGDEIDQFTPKKVEFFSKVKNY